MVGVTGGGRPGAPWPAHDQPGGALRRGLEILLMMMRAAPQEYGRAMGGIVERAKSTLAALGNFGHARHKPCLVVLRPPEPHMY